MVSKNKRPKTGEKSGPDWANRFFDFPKNIPQQRTVLRTLLLTSLILSILPFQKNLPAFAQSQSCSPMGWYPTDFSLKDHSVFWYNGYYYIVSIYLPGERSFAYARSTNLCDWEDLSPVLPERAPGSQDETAIWAPFVYKEEGTYYMYYTGVDKNFTQRILLATTSTPDDPASWQPQGEVFQPYHQDMVWEEGTWADCRDATVIKQDSARKIIGLATSTSPAGPWIDWGNVLPAYQSNLGMMESPAVVKYDGFFYLFYTDTYSGAKYWIGASPGGPWIDQGSLTPGWAHEIWTDHDGNYFTSYLKNYQIVISPLVWDTMFEHPHPFIGAAIFHSLLPILAKTDLR
jgi:beta-xylosidase